jgi:cytidyltransferase-like protein
MEDFKNKYLKYKNKYLNLKKQLGGEIINIGVYIGRFQPIHVGHLQIIKEGIKNEDKFLVICGSIDKQNVKNPFSFEQRKEFIIGALTEDEKKKITVLGLRDSTEEDNKADPIWWYNRVKEMINSLKEEGKEYNVYLYGSSKDALTDEYLKLLQQHSGITSAKLVSPTSVMLDGKEVSINATDIRTILNKEVKTVEDIKYLETVLPSNLKTVLINQ